MFFYLFSCIYLFLYNITFGNPRESGYKISDDVHVFEPEIMNISRITKNTKTNYHCSSSFSLNTDTKGTDPTVHIMLYYYYHDYL